MCCFSGRVDRVAKTKIFARSLGGERQCVVYSMNLSASAELAMVLPIPITIGAGEDAVRFVDLSGYPKFFEDLEVVFPKPQASRGGYQMLGDAPAAIPKLVVHEVGSFEASFVPRLEDFERLDARFRLPAAVWSSLPEHKTYGFVVVKLKATVGEQHVHPFAFDFPNRHAGRIFFPTLHVHDGEVHAKAEFDHCLYTQSPTNMQDWSSSMAPVGTLVDKVKAKGLIDETLAAHKRELIGSFQNSDYWL